MELTPGARLGPYEIVSPLGAGGMGEVWKALDTRLDRTVAIKVMPAYIASREDLRQRFEREARTVSNLKHPNICVLHDIGKQDGTDFMVLEYLEGETLAARIAKGPMPLDQVLKYATQIGDALDRAHRSGVSHRDVKPANVMITRDGCKVLDFGLAKTAPRLVAGPDDPTLTAALTSDGAILGTPQYMAPEQYEGKEADARSDIFSFGCVVYEMVTGKRCFQGKTKASLIAAVLGADPPSMSSLAPVTPPALERLVKRCIAKDPEDRYQSMRDVVLDLRDVGEGGTGGSRADVGVRPTWWIAMAGAFAVALAGLAFVHFRETPPVRQHVRFQVQPPEGRLLDYQLSPDGRFLAISTYDGTVPKIWVRALDSVDARLLTSAADLDSHLFWSADGEYVGFAGSDKLYRIARSGGPPVVICDLPAQRSYAGAAWGSDGTILFAASGVAPGVYRVASSGGTPGKVNDERARVPVWLNGDRFLFSTLAGIFTGSLTGTKPSLLLHDVSNSVFVPRAKSGLPDHLLFIRGETLMAQPIDGSKAELRGEAFTVAEGVGNLGSGPTLGAFSASATGVLVFGRGVAEKRELVWLDRTGKKLQTVSRPFSEAVNPSIRLSPDDSRAIISVAGANAPDLWIADLNRNALSRFTLDGSFSGIWSPDGRMVLWSARDGNRYLRPADGSGKDELLFKAPASGGYLYDWSSDGKRIAFVGNSETNQLQIWLLGADGDRKPYPYLQAPFPEYWARMSPDGRWMAYVSKQSGQPEVMVESIPAGKGRWQISTAGGDWPVWRRDGKELFFRQGKEIMAVSIRLTETSVESGQPQPLFEVPDNQTRFQVSRDGQRFLIALPVAGAATSSPLTVDTDWRAGISK